MDGSMVRVGVTVMVRVRVGVSVKITGLMLVFTCESPKSLAKVGSRQSFGFANLPYRRFT